MHRDFPEFGNQPNLGKPVKTISLSANFFGRRFFFVENFTNTFILTFKRAILIKRYLAIRCTQFCLLNHLLLYSLLSYNVILAIAFSKGVKNPVPDVRAEWSLLE